jgi:hypothetical protein
MNTSGVIESIFDKVLEDKEKGILKIKIEDIINESEINSGDDVEIELCLKSKPTDEEKNKINSEKVSSINPNFDPISDMEITIEKAEEMVRDPSPKTVPKSSIITFLERLLSCSRN